MSSSDADSGGPTPRVHRAWSGVAFLVISAVIAVFLLFVGGVVFVILRLHKKKMRERAAAIKDGDPDG